MRKIPSLASKGTVRALKMDGFKLRHTLQNLAESCRCSLNNPPIAMAGIFWELEHPGVSVSLFSDGPFFRWQAAAKGVDDWAKNPTIQPPSLLALSSSSGRFGRFYPGDSRLYKKYFSWFFVAEFQTIKSRLASPEPKDLVYFCHLALREDILRPMMGHAGSPSPNYL